MAPYYTLNACKYPIKEYNFIEHTERCVGSVGKQTTLKQCTGASMVEGEQCMT